MRATPAQQDLDRLGEWARRPGATSRLESVRALWRRRALLLQTTRSDLRARYAGSVLGVAWLLLYPLVFLGIYAFVFVLVFQVRFETLNSVDYVGLIFCGLVPFLAFSEALGSGVSSVASNASLIRNTLYPIEFIPAKAVLTTQVTLVVGTVMLALAMAVMGRLTVWALVVPFVWVLQFMLTLGVVWVLALINVYVRELQNLVAVINLGLMLVSPIAYTESMVPEKVRFLLAFNPLYYLIGLYRDALFHGRPPDVVSVGVVAVGALAVFLGGLWFFVRLKMAFVDNV